jgi:hypothetical protein
MFEIRSVATGDSAGSLIDLNNACAVAEGQEGPSIDIRNKPHGPVGRGTFWSVEHA